MPFDEGTSFYELCEGMNGKETRNNNTITLYTKKEVYDRKILPRLKENYLSEPVTEESSVCHILKYGPVLTESSRKTSNISVTLNTLNPIFGRLEKFLTKEDIE
jgi:hypothetical protein